ncbi:hypothetical protein E3P99_03789 [Wallemia hederae]|uniref:Serine/threonine-protein phosphatase n=1 Tax=Wallemia hederae TaxID=1540922 RepID=A0A4V6TMA2_9BASI|nr:hypothetical protein E3P99_03789 [Wallemia hederae]
MSTHKEKGNELYKNKDFVNAIEQWLLVDPQTEQVLNNVATAKFKLEEFGLAVEYSTKALDINNKFVKALYRRAMAHVAVLHFKPAIADLKAVLAIEPSNKTAAHHLNEISKIHRRMQFEAAIATEDEKQASDVVKETISNGGCEIPEDYDGPTLETPNLIDELIEYFKKGKTLHKRVLFELVLKTIDLFSQEESLVDVNIPAGHNINVIGDTHGQFYDLVHLIGLTGKPSESNYLLFNGDFVDRGSWSTEVIILLLAMKYLHPKSVFLNRGNHETRQMTQVYGFEGECKHKYPTDLTYKLFAQLFTYLPIAHLLSATSKATDASSEAITTSDGLKRYFVVHGGLFSKDDVTLDDVRKIKRNREPGQEGLMCEALWTDPQDADGRGPSKRGVGVGFGPDVTKRWCELNQVTAVIRSHEVRQDGFSYEHNGRLITVFSAPNYCDTSGNKGAFFMIDESGTLRERQFAAVEHPPIKPMAYSSGMANREMRAYLTPIISLTLIPFIQAFPKIDYDSLGTVSILGSFAAVDDISNSSKSTKSYDNSTYTILSRPSNASDWTSLGSTNPYSHVNSACKINDLTFAGGDFGAIDGQQIANFGVHSEENGWQALESVQGIINALYCDSSNSQVWVGGAFDAIGEDMGANIAIWNVLEQHWQPSAVYGLNGAVNSFSRSDDQLFITGNFTSTFNQPDGNQYPNALDRIVDALQPIPFADADITGSKGSDNPAYSDIKNLACVGGNSFDTPDGTSGVMYIEWFDSHDVAGFRLANTVDEGHALTGFTITTIPDNQVIPLIYNDINSPETNTTCQDECPIALSQDREYNDYIIPGGSRRLSGFAINMIDWTGAGPGLRSVEVFGAGSDAHAISEFNELQEGCFSNGNPSNVTTIGDWTAVNPSSESSNRVLSAEVQGDETIPSITFKPHVGQRGLYEIHISIPGCAGLKDCESRSALDVEMQLTERGHYINDTITDIDENDVSLPIFRGMVDGSSTTFEPNITVRPTETDEGKTVAVQKVTLHLLEVFPNEIAIGGLAYNLTSGDTLNASADRELADQSYLDRALVSLADAIGIQFKEGEQDLNYVKTIVNTDSDIFIGGKFVGFNDTMNNITNIALFNDRLHSLPGGGVNGNVNKLTVVDDQVYIAGNFTKAGSVECQNIIKYDHRHRRFDKLGHGVDGEVYDMTYAPELERLYLAGNFTNALFDETASVTVGGLVSWDLKENTWKNDNGVVYAELVKGVAVEDKDLLVYGSVERVAQFSANGVAEISSDGLSAVSGTNVLGSTKTSSSSTSSRKRATPHLPSASSVAPAINAGNYYKNSTSLYTILGGNFTFNDGDSSAVALIDQDNNMHALAGGDLSGDVRAMMVVGDKLFLGGQFRAGNSTDVAVYDLKKGAYVNIGNGLEGTTTDFAYNQIHNGAIISGDFSAVSGNQDCSSICEWDIGENHWKSLGQGVKGFVSDVEVAGDDDRFAIAVGDFAINREDDLIFIATYDYEDKVWARLGDGDLPGVPTAVEADDKDIDNVFIAGRRTGSNETYVYNYEGETFTDISDGMFEGTGRIHRLEFLPVEEEGDRDDDGFIENDRILYATGDITLRGVGRVSSAMYDGREWHPHLQTFNSDGSTGALASIMYSSDFSFTARDLLALGIIILISIALGLGVVLLLALIAILVSLWERRGESRPILLENDEKDENVRPSSLLENINQATTNIARGSATNAQALAPTPIIKLNDEETEKGPNEKITDNELSGADDSFDRSYSTNASTSDQPPQLPPADLNNGVGYRCYARYDFAGDQQGELPLIVGQQVQVLNDSDQEWFFVRDPASTQEGVVPSSYLF